MGKVEILSGPFPSILRDNIYLIGTAKSADDMKVGKNFKREKKALKEWYYNDIEKEHG